LAGTGDRLSTQPDLLLVYQPFDQVSSDNSDDENVHRESQNEFFLEHGAKDYNSGMLAPAPPMMRARTVPNIMPFPIRAALIGITVSARKDKPGPKKQSNKLALLEFSIARSYYYRKTLSDCCK
jgi:hypothetical protein